MYTGWLLSQKHIKCTPDDYLETYRMYTGWLLSQEHINCTPGDYLETYKMYTGWLLCQKHIKCTPGDCLRLSKLNIDWSWYSRRYMNCTCRSLCGRLSHTLCTDRLLLVIIIIIENYMMSYLKKKEEKRWQPKAHSKQCKTTVTWHTWKIWILIKKE